MSEDKSTVDESIVIGHNYWDVPVRVELSAYLRFGHRLDLQLRRLVLRWQHAAAPGARGSRRQQTERRRKPR